MPTIEEYKELVIDFLTPAKVILEKGGSLKPVGFTLGSGGLSIVYLDYANKESQSKSHFTLGTLARKVFAECVLIIVDSFFVEVKNPDKLEEAALLLLSKESEEKQSALSVMLLDLRTHQSYATLCKYEVKDLVYSFSDPEPWGKGMQGPASLIIEGYLRAGNYSEN